MRRVARLGIENSLVQTVCKLTAPGVPDIYQGCELWDLALVDPDNRRPVDFALRETAMKDLAARLEAPEKRAALFTTLMDEWQGGRAKLAATAILLRLRRDEPELFANGDYQPLVIEGERSDWAFGYMRALGEKSSPSYSPAIPRVARPSACGTPARNCRKADGSMFSAAGKRLPPRRCTNG